MLSVLANALIPIFIGLAFGFIAGQRRIVDNVNVRNLIIFLMSFALPCALYATISHTSHDDVYGQTGPSLVLMAVYLITYGVTYFSARFAGESVADSAVIALTIGFPNATAVGLPLLQASYGSAGTVAAATAIAIGAVTISPITLALLEGTVPNRPHASLLIRCAAAGSKAIRRPVVWAPVLGLLAVLLHIHLPVALDRTLMLFGSATAGVALFLTGLVVSAQPLSFDWRIALAVLGKNVGQPALCLGLAKAVNLPLEQTRYVVLVSAIPCGFFGIVFGKEFQASSSTASSSLILSYGAGIFTLVGWMVLLNHLH